MQFPYHLTRPALRHCWLAQSSTPHRCDLDINRLGGILSRVQADRRMEVDQETVSLPKKQGTFLRNLCRREGVRSRGRESHSDDSPMPNFTGEVNSAAMFFNNFVRQRPALCLMRPGARRRIAHAGLLRQLGPRQRAPLRRPGGSGAPPRRACPQRLGTTGGSRPLTCAAGAH